MVSTQTGDGGDESRRLNFDAAGENPETVGDGDASLEETAEREREYLRERLRDELRREPTEEELNEWLREHTEGY
jgi:phage portal protein BeeE